MQQALYRFTFGAPPLAEWKRRAFYDADEDVAYLAAHTIGDEGDVMCVAGAERQPVVACGGHYYLPAGWLARTCREGGDDAMADAIGTAVATMRRAWAERG